MNELRTRDMNLNIQSTEFFISEELWLYHFWFNDTLKEQPPIKIFMDTVAIKVIDFDLEKLDTPHPRTTFLWNDYFYNNLNGSCYEAALLTALGIYYSQGGNKS